MALEKVILIDLITVNEHGEISVRTSTRILEDGELLSEKYHRHTVEPGDNLDEQAPEVKAIGLVVHTQDKIDKYKQYKEDKMKEKDLI